MIDWMMNNLEAEGCGMSGLSTRLSRFPSPPKDRITVKKEKKSSLIVSMCVIKTPAYWLGKPITEGTVGEMQTRNPEPPMLNLILY